MSILVGYEVGSGRDVHVPLKHTAVLGQTQESGKTTTQEAMIMRSRLRALAFITRRGEKSFRVSRPIPVYFRESSTGEYWKYVASIMEGICEIKVGFQEKGWLIKLCREYNREGKKGTGYKWKAARSLEQLRDNVNVALPHLRGTAELICIQLQEYLNQAIPEIAAHTFSDKLALSAGINVMDIADFSRALQSLVIRSCIEWIHRREKNTIVIIPEAWKFISRARSPVKDATEALIREGAALKNFVWFDSQDLRGVDPLLLRSVGLWVFGVQRERNEVKMTLDSIPDLPKPTEAQIMSLRKGQFYVVHGDTCVRTYVRPHGMGEEHAKAIARGEESPESWKQIVAELESEPDAIDVGGDDGQPVQSGDGDAIAAPDRTDIEVEEENKEASEDEAMWKERAEKAEAENAQLTAEVARLREEVQKQGRILLRLHGMPQTIENPPAPHVNGGTDINTLWPEIRKRILADPTLIELGITEPEIVIAIKRHTVSMDTATLNGQIARLLHQGFFKSPRVFGDLRAELIRIGAMDKKSGNAPIGNALSKLHEMGFLTQESAGYQEVPGMKVRIIEGK